MLSPADVIIIGAFALIVFGPEQLPKVARRAGQVVREVQNTSQTFVREMERAAEETEYREREHAAWTPPPVEHIADPTPAPGAPFPTAPGASEPYTTVEGERGHGEPLPEHAPETRP